MKSGKAGITAALLFLSLQWIVAGESVAADPPSSPAPGATGWGKSTEGVRCRLRADKRIWPAGEATFKIDLRSEKRHPLPIGPVYDEFHVEIDGKWLQNVSGVDIRSSIVRTPVTARDGIHLFVGRHWQEKPQDPCVSLLSPGTHVIRIGYVLRGENGKAVHPVRAVSNPVEIEIRPSRASGREKTARMKLALRKKNKPGKTFFGLDLTAAPRTMNPAELPLLFEKKAPPELGFRLRKDVIVTRHPEEWRAGVIYYVPAGNCFYVISEPGHPGSGSTTFYGPFSGDPWKKVGMPEPRPTVEKHRFALYLVADPLDVGAAAHPALERLHLAPEPVFTEKDLINYDWTTHTLTLKKGSCERLPAPSVWGVPFMVVAEGKRCYLGAFWSGLSSYMPRIPTIGTDPWMRPGPKQDTIRIEAARVRDKAGKQHDVRSDERIRKALGKLPRRK
jgi:hypothetical protein